MKEFLKAVCIHTSKDKKSRGCFFTERMSGDQDGCEWVNVSSGTGLPR